MISTQKSDRREAEGVGPERAENTSAAKRRPLRISPVVLVALLAFVGFGVCAWCAQRWLHSSPPTDMAGDELHDGDPVRVSVPAWKSTLLLAEGTRFDFGEVPGGEKLSHTFPVKNVGRSPVPLGELKMTCACNASVEFDQEVCPPGESCGIRVTTTAAGFGPQSKSLPFAIAADDSTAPVFKLELAYRTARTKQVTFVPARVEFGPLFPSHEPDTREVQLVLIGPPDEPAPEVEKLTCDNPAVRVELVAREIPDVSQLTARAVPAQRVVCRVALHVDANQLPVGPVHGHVTARTSIGEAKLVVRGEVSRAVTATPASVLVERNRTSASRHVVRLRSGTEQPIDIVEVWCGAPGVTCSVEQGKSELHLEIATTAELGPESVAEIVAEAGGRRELLRVQLVEF